MTTPDSTITVRVPGRVNLIGDHTDYTGGLVLPMVVDLHTTVSGRHTDERLWRLESETHGSAVIPLDVERADLIDPAWARYPAGVIVEMRTLGVDVPGFVGTVSTTLPVGAGLSSSAALEVATARIALGNTGQQRHPMLRDVELAQLCRRAEYAATGIPCGIMDQLSIVCGRAGFATLIDCSTLDIADVAIPDDVIIEHRFVAARTLVGSEYAERVEQCREIESLIGPLRQARLDDVETIASDLLRRRARHVVSENARVRAFAEAMRHEDVDEAGRLMIESHRSLATDYATSTPAMDTAVDRALEEPGVLGARMTGGGFGGCIVILRRR